MPKRVRRSPGMGQNDGGLQVRMADEVAQIVGVRVNSHKNLTEVKPIPHVKT
ncbi:hypothetical protein JCM14720_01510 [Calditerricola yamamurae]